jgi:hypothetical protein
MFLCLNNMFPHWNSSGTRIGGHLVLTLQVIQYQKVLQSCGVCTIIRHSHSMSFGTHTQCHLVLTIHDIWYPHSISSGTHTPYHLVLTLQVIKYQKVLQSSSTHSQCHPVPTLHVIWYSHSISSGTRNSTHLVLEFSRNHPVPKFSTSSGTSINNRSVLDYSRKFGMLLKENRGHGFFP